MTDLRKLFHEELKLCAVGPGQKVAVLSEGAQLRDYAEASLAAAKDLGAEVVDVNLPSANALEANERLKNIGANGLADHPWAMDACMTADIVVDHMLLLFSKEQIAMQEAGARMLMAVEPVEILDRLFPTQELRRRVEAAERRLATGKTLRFTNGAGTDVTYRLNNDVVLPEYGFTDRPGRWDHWPGGFVATMAHAGAVEGKVVLAPGDILFPMKASVNDPIEFVIRNGTVVEINGGQDATAMRHYMEKYGDPRAYAISHIGWGLNQGCIWDPNLPGIGMDGRAHYGNVLFALGPDTEFGGSNDTACHLDLPMQHCTLWVDDELILEDGKVVPKDMSVLNQS